MTEAKKKCKKAKILMFWKFSILNGSRNQDIHNDWIGLFNIEKSVQRLIDTFGIIILMY